VDCNEKGTYKRNLENKNCFTCEQINCFLLYVPNHLKFEAAAPTAHVKCSDYRLVPTDELSYCWNNNANHFLSAVLILQTADGGNVSRSTTYTPRVDDVSKDLECRAENL